MNLIEVTNQSFRINGTTIQPIRAMHLKLPVYGYRIGDLAYITDANYISPEEMEKLKGIKILVVNALRKEKHISHYNLSEALDLVNELKPEKAYFTHISHQMGFYDDVQAELPANVYLAYDELTIEV